MFVTCLKLILLYVICPSSAYKILVVYPVPIPSLTSLGAATARHLLDAGHEVTFVNAYPGKYKFNNKNYHEVDISTVTSSLAGDDILNVTHMIENKEEVAKHTMSFFHEFMTKLAEMTLENANMRELLNNQVQQFDAVIVDYFENEFFAGLAALYKCPMVWSYSMGPHWNVMRLVGGYPNPNYSSDYYTVNLPPFTFSKRLQQLWTRFQWYWRKWWFVDAEVENLYTQLYKPFFEKRGNILPGYHDVSGDAALVLCNDQMALGNVPSLPLNFKLIGGFHIEKSKPLPKDLQVLMDSSQDGVIYFSMGSTWQSKDMPKPMVDALLLMFGKLKQTVIWKFEASLPNVPKNVHILKWAPQSSILDHPNCLFFITHGGHLSSTEAIHFGVAVINIPIYMDQHVNAQKAVVHGYGLKVNLDFNLANSLEKAIQQMLNDDRYSKKAKELSDIYHDQPTSPGAELVHWVEHIIKTKGGHHLRSPSRHFTWIQLFYLDLFLIVSVILGLLFVPVLFILRRKSSSKKTKKSKRS